MSYTEKPCKHRQVPPSRLTLQRLQKRLHGTPAKLESGSRPAVTCRASC